MNSNTRRELMDALSILVESRNLRVTVNQSLKAGAIVGGSTMLGALMAGPIGIVLGSAVGTFISYTNTPNFKSVAQVFRDDLSEREKDRLCDAVIEACRSTSWEEVGALIMLLQTCTSFQSLAMQTVIKFLTSDMHMTIID